MKITKNININVDFDLTVADIAKEFANMSSTNQALFFNEVANIASKWTTGSFVMQLQYVTESIELNANGRRIMGQIGEYSIDGREKDV